MQAMSLTHEWIVKGLEQKERGRSKDWPSFEEKADAESIKFGSYACERWAACVFEGTAQEEYEWT